MRWVLDVAGNSLLLQLIMRCRLLLPVWSMWETEHMFEASQSPVAGPPSLTAAAAVLDAIPLDSYEGLAPAEQVVACEQLGRLESRVKAHQLAVAGAMETCRAADILGATSTGALLANTFGGDPAAAKRLLGQAKRLEAVTDTQAALGRGEVTLAQAELIAHTIKDLPGDPCPEQREACETQLLRDAPRLTLKDLSRRADRITEVFAPDQVDVIENDILEEREAAAWAKSYFWIVDRRDGTFKGEFVIPEAQGAMLKNCLNAINAPQVRNAQVDPSLAVLDEAPTYGQQLADAFCTLIEHIPADKLPDTAGVGAIMTVNLDYETLLGKIKAATLSDGCRISAGEARRMACELRILPMVFDGKSLPLDHGRDKRRFQRPQRRAMEKRDRGCTFPGCDRPPSWCIGHHARKRWAEGAGTDLEDGVSVCAYHHRYIHAHAWEVVFAHDGVPEWIPPITLDPAQKPIRNQRFRADAA